MPSVYRDSVNKKVNPFAQGYNPNIELVDYYDAKGDEYPNKINEASPSYEIHEFDTYPQMNDGSANISIVNAVPLDKDLNPVSDWDDSLDAITDKKMSDDMTHETYEETCEAAIKYCLENLI